MRVPEGLRNQYTTLDAERAKAKELSSCRICGIFVEKRRKFCRPCWSQRLSEFDASRQRKVRALKKQLKPQPSGARRVRAEKPAKLPRLISRRKRWSSHDDLTGQRFDTFEILSLHASGNGGRIWLVRCACSRELLRSATSLIEGKAFCDCLGRSA